ncbi:hypothetical protein RJ640_003230 [Escallonia rubra]|uniref:DUF4218 domain-containing protein n=1 Tax=Escallonia rubra TaxID=112253 RepID=A0AA88RGD5_9ASTE|nr:hypothetical protein RJ640_003230 [Escallonia rubra]
MEGPVGAQPYLFTLKGYVRNRSRPEDSIAEGYWLEECVTFCSRYLIDDVETKLNRPVRLDDGGDTSINSVGGRPLEASEGFVLDDISYAQAHRYVLVNSDAITQYRRLNVLSRTSDVVIMAERMAAGVHSGCAPFKSAATPAACRHDMDVPDNRLKSLKSLPELNSVARIF